MIQASLIRVKNPKNSLKIGLLLMILLVVALYYDILFDTIILTIFLLASYSIGESIKVQFSHLLPRILVQLSMGMGVLGFVMHFILLLGIGNKTLYLVLLLLPIFMKHDQIQKTIKEMGELYRETEQKFVFHFILICVLVVIFAGNTTISFADALAKYLSLVTYAAENGAWKTNIVESIIYADQFTMYCSLATIGVALGAKRFLIWIATICMCLTLLLLAEFVKAIYKDTNIVMLTAIFFTTPFFLKLGLDMSIDFAHVAFLFAAMLCMANMDTHAIWDNLYAICILCGSAIFSKLTASYIVLAIGIPVIISFFIYVICNKVSFYKIISKMLLAIGCLIGGLIIPIFYGFYYMGTPVAPWLNKLFKSPYVAQGNFVDPYQNSAYGLNLNTLFKIVFHTSLNTEAMDGSMGVFLLGLLLIPLGLALHRKKAYLFWSILNLIMFKLSSLFTYNLRYYIAIIILFLALINITLSIIIDKIIHGLYIKKIVSAIITIAMVIPNLYIISKMPFEPLSLKSAGVTYEEVAPKLLKKYVPEDSWVFADNSTCLRGDWTGVLYSNSWYNTYLMEKKEKDQISYKRLLEGFDYIIVRNEGKYATEEFSQIIYSADKKDSILEKYAECDSIIIFKVRDSYPQKIYEYSEGESQEASFSNPFIIDWRDLNSEQYKVSLDVTNESDEIITIRYLLCFYDENFNMLSAESIFTLVESGEHHIESANIKGNSEAVYATFSLCSYSSEPVYLNGLLLEGGKDRSYIKNLVQEYYERVPLKNREEF